ncbi:hypothetical protein [Corallococcus exiguus]|uniref:Uncharacterized protein n=1 Tax=Corallococcus exiguus TaxID=83462 RepID=A0A7X4YJ86_9BACT|nr:hypothetical protein [Corallococcus exiguus]NBC45402.1 hypothetical protein [Corallococcus exiguus]TNV61565.1 hypothetical protein FH620_20745 [Corallococcus exiguus]
MHERIPTPARYWASRVLLLACASVVATSRVRSSDELSPVLSGTPVRLTMNSARVMRTRVVRAEAKEGSSVPAVGELRLMANAKWTPSDPTQTAQPRLSINSYDGQTDRGRAIGRAPNPGARLPASRSTRERAAARHTDTRRVTAR